MLLEMKLYMAEQNALRDTWLYDLAARSPGTVALIMALFLGHLAVQASRVSARHDPRPQNTLFILLDFITVLAVFALYGWGFSQRPWWIPAGAFFGVSLLVGLVFSRRGGRHIVALILLRPLYGGLATGAALLLWAATIWAKLRIDDAF